MPGRGRAGVGMEAGSLPFKGAERGFRRALLCARGAGPACLPGRGRAGVGMGSLPFKGRAGVGMGSLPFKGRAGVGMGFMG
ncbi:MAG: hypothetical protein KatS3mg123_3057 [Burkholderiales bacterium]|nr:MAG: hypothetical protein KatS3mg123_3057 [Burkholderiales bacterium]